MQAPFGIWEFATILFIAAFLLWHFWISRRHWQDILLEGTEQSTWEDTLTLQLARGFGLGQLPKAPGTWGSLGGLVWTALLLVPQNFWLYLGGTVIGLALSIWICGRAEKLIGKTDPPEVVLDEITAVPICYAPLIAVHPNPSLQHLLGNHGAWFWILTGFVLFRVFDICKPPPIKRLQTLPAGWGITLDDTAAGMITAAMLYGVWLVVS